MPPSYQHRLQLYIVSPHSPAYPFFDNPKHTNKIGRYRGPLRFALFRRHDSRDLCLASACVQYNKLLQILALLLLPPLGLYLYNLKHNLKVVPRLLSRSLSCSYVSV